MFNKETKEKVDSLNNFVTAAEKIKKYCSSTDEFIDIIKLAVGKQLSKSAQDSITAREKEDFKNNFDYENDEFEDDHGPYEECSKETCNSYGTNECSICKGELLGITPDDYISESNKVEIDQTINAITEACKKASGEKPVINFFRVNITNNYYPEAPSKDEE